MKDVKFRPLPKKPKKLKYRYSNKRLKENIIWKDKKNGLFYIIIDGYLWHKCPRRGYWISGDELLHRYIWEKYNGKPKGKICFKDGNKDNYDISNLYDSAFESYNCGKIYRYEKRLKTVRARKEAARKRKKLSKIRKERWREKLEALKEMESQELINEFLRIMKS